MKLADYVIHLAPDKFYAPEGIWSRALESARVGSKEELLDVVRERVERDRREKVVPFFTGARVASVKSLLLFELTRRGLKASETINGFALEVGNAPLDKVRAEWPQSIHGFPIVLLRGKNVVPWGAPKPKEVALAPWQKNRH